MCERLVDAVMVGDVDAARVALGEVRPVDVLQVGAAARRWAVEQVQRSGGYR